MDNRSGVFAAPRGILVAGRRGHVGACQSARRILGSYATVWTTRWVLPPFGGPAASLGRPVALRPRLATGLPLSWVSTSRPLTGRSKGYMHFTCAQNTRPPEMLWAEVPSTGSFGPHLSPYHLTAWKQSTTKFVLDGGLRISSARDFSARRRFGARFVDYIHVTRRALLSGTPLTDGLVTKNAATAVKPQSSRSRRNAHALAGRTTDSRPSTSWPYTSIPESASFWASNGKT
jgi:hypothetical protein